jgi:hypothetical protein
MILGSDGLKKLRRTWLHIDIRLDCAAGAGEPANPVNRPFHGRCGGVQSRSTRSVNVCAEHSCQFGLEELCKISTAIPSP